MKKLLIAIFIATFSFCLFTSNASAVAILHISNNGQLLGAQGVIVNNNYYSVEFKDGSYASLFDANGSGLTFRSRYNAILASQALLDQVFLDNNYGLFDSDPTLTNGIETTMVYGGVISTPYTVPYLNIHGSYQYYWGATLNNLSIENDEVSGWTTGSSGNSFDSSSNHWLTYAVWEQQPAPVPEPSTLAMMVGGLFFTILARKVKYK